MKSRIHRTVGSLFLASTLALAVGCAPPKPASNTAEAPAQREAVTRNTAIQNAQRDAAFRYAEVQVARVEAHKQGAFWVVELMSPTGSGLRYTISAHDGSIRGRNTFQ